MKLQNLLLTLFAAGALFAGCKEKEPEPELPNLNVGQTELAFEQGGGSGSITVTSNRPWTISTDADWLAFNPSNGSAQSGPVTVSVTALPNTSTDRTASFKVKTDFDFRTVNVSQKGSKGEDPNVTPSGSGTASDPYNVAAALAKATSLQALNSSSDELTSANSADVYTAGKVVDVEIDPGYGNATYHISADGTSTVQLEVYRGKYLDGTNFVTKDQLKAGDDVVVYGTLVNFKGNTPEYTAGSKLISVNGETKPAEIDYTKFQMTNVKAFIEKAAKGEFFRLKGKVSRFNSQYCSFDLTDETGTIYVYSVNNKEEWQEKIKNGGTVELAGLYEYYEKNSQHEVVSAQILSFEEGAQEDYSNAEAKTVAEFIAAANKETYFKLTGTVSKFNSQYCSFDITDESGSIYVYSVANKADWSSKISNDGTVTLAGKYDYYATKEQHEVIEAYILSFEAAAPPEAQDATVAEALAADKDAVLKVGPAVVMASSSVGFLMAQDGAMIYVYGGNAAVGENVTVEATRTEYQGVPQLSSPKVTVNSTGAEVTYPTAKDITSSFASYSSETREYVTFAGKLNISGNYYNITVDGSTSVTGSIVKPVEDISSLNGKDVTITGYYLYHTSQGKYLYVIPTKVNDIAINGAAGGGDTPGGDTPGGDTPGEGGKISWKAAGDWTGVADGAETISYKSGSITITATKASGKTKPTVNGSANDCRVYAAGTVTVTTTGDAMTSIVFNISSQGQKRLTSITASTGSVAKQASGDKTVKWTGSAKTVTFTVGEKATYGSEGADKAGQFDFSSVEIK
ncbi:MAG: BACON domain-containing protein [Bacteroidales bacterium]|nr:BACON domain-containing protein [Bacteroidales bacterium]